MENENNKIVNGSDTVKKVVDLIEWELENECDIEVYPEICRRKNDIRQKNVIIRNAISLIAKNKGMTIDGALAQIESSYQELNS